MKTAKRFLKQQGIGKGTNISLSLTESLMEEYLNEYKASQQQVFYLKDMRAFAVDFSYFMFLKGYNGFSSHKCSEIFDEWIEPKLPTPKVEANKMYSEEDLINLVIFTMDMSRTNSDRLTYKEVADKFIQSLSPKTKHKTR